MILFTEALDGLGLLTSFRTTYDGMVDDVIEVFRLFDPPTNRRVALRMASRIPAGAVVEVYYDPSLASSPLSDASGNAVRSFGWSLDTTSDTNRRILTNVYDALKAYFTGDGTLGEVNSVIREVNDETYHQRLLEETEAGRLHENFEAGERTQWGTDEAAGWTQKGSPSFPGADPSLTCGGVGKPALTGADASRFFWACTEDDRWVPVKLAQPGVDYSEDGRLVTPDGLYTDGTTIPSDGPTYNEMCRFKDADGNPTPVFRAEFDSNGRVVRNSDGSIRGTTIHGHNWDPLAQQCTGRGGS